MNNLEILFGLYNKKNLEDGNSELGWQLYDAREAGSSSSRLSGIPRLRLQPHAYGMAAEAGAVNSMLLLMGWGWRGTEYKKPRLPAVYAPP